MADLEPLDLELQRVLRPERHSIPDDGFTARVLARLPQRQRRRWRREAIIPGMTFLGCLSALFILPGGAVLRDFLLRLPHAQFVSALPLAWLIGVYALCWAAVTSAMESRELTSLSLLAPFDRTGPPRHAPDD